MTAIQRFYDDLKAGQLPAAVPLPEDQGMAAAGFDVFLKPSVFQAAHSEDPQTRAALAIYACQAAHEAVDSGSVSR